MICVKYLIFLLEKQTQTTKLKIGYKFGLEFINSKNGRNFVGKLKNKIIFDYKLRKTKSSEISLK